jgi:hypothetical protein
VVTTMRTGLIDGMYDVSPGHCAASWPSLHVYETLLLMLRDVQKEVRRSISTHSELLWHSTSFYSLPISTCVSIFFSTISYSNFCCWLQIHHELSSLHISWLIGSKTLPGSSWKCLRENRSYTTSTKQSMMSPSSLSSLPSAWTSSSVSSSIHSLSWGTTR